MLRVQAWAQTDIGKQRGHNEDNYILDQAMGLYGVADGMGGHAAGEIASQMALEMLSQAISKRSNELNLLVEENPEKHRKKIIAIVTEAIQYAARQVYDLSRTKASSRGMGTTLSSILTLNSKGVISHVGDSRVFLLRDGQLQQLTEDHSLVREQLRLGLITEEEAERSPYKNVITRAVGASEELEPDVLFIDLQANDRFLLCSDGLHGYMNETEIQAFMADKDPQKIPSKLIDIANERGGRDNITAIILHIEQEHSEQVTPPKSPDLSVSNTPQPRRAEITLRMDTLQKLSLFEHMTYDELVRIMEITYLKTYQPTDIVFKEDSKGESIYILLKGEIGIFSKGHRLHTIQEGQHFGELSLFKKEPHHITAIAEKSDTQLLTIQRKSLITLMQKEPTLAVKLMWSILKELVPRTNNNIKKIVELLGQKESSDYLPNP